MIVEFKSIENGWLSNFYEVDIEYDGMIYPSVEHAYMSAKSNDQVYFKGQLYNWKNLCANTSIPPGVIKVEGRKVNLIENWDKMKLHVMYICLKNKFLKEPLRSKLLETGDQNIQEGNFHKDDFYGIRLDVIPNYGENHLGRLIMRVRDELKIK